MAESKRYPVTLIAVEGTSLRVIRVRCPPEFRFRPGQYLTVHADGAPVPMSIASAPHRLPELELHYRSQAAAPEAEAMDRLLAARTGFDISGPDGSVTVEQAPDRPLILVAGGTGAAQAFSIIEHLARDAARPPPCPVELLWVNAADADFYRPTWLTQCGVPWLTTHTFTDPTPGPGNRLMVWLADHGAGYAGACIVLCGGPGFVYQAVDCLVASGCAQTAIASDVFSYAPR